MATTERPWTNITEPRPVDRCLSCGRFVGRYPVFPKFVREPWNRTEHRRGPMTTAQAQNHLPTNAYVMPNYWKGTMTRREAKETLLATSGWIMACGYIYDVIVDDAGAGVCRVRLEVRP